MQLKIYVPKHPLIEHLANLIQIVDIPPTLVRSSVIEIANWLCYEAIRNRLSLSEVPSNNIDGTSITQFINPEDQILAMPLIKSGLLMSGSLRNLSSNIVFSYINFQIEYKTRLCDVTQEDKLSMDGLSQYSQFLILDSIVLSSDRILSLLSFMKSKSVDLSSVCIILILCTSDVLRDIGNTYPDLTIYTSCIKDVTSPSELLSYQRLLDTLQT
nr:hypothetical protein [Porphyrostromium boryanum]